MFLKIFDLGEGWGSLLLRCSLIRIRFAAFLCFLYSFLPMPSFVLAPAFLNS